MADKWRETTLGEVIELKRGYDLPSRDRRVGQFPVVSSSGVTGYHAEAKAKAPGVVIGRYGTLGEVHYITKDYWPLNTSLYVHDFKGNDPRFLSYLLRSLDFRAYSDKAAVPGLNRNDLHRSSVWLPPVREQRAIAEILGTLDDKIELNRRMNETLEAIARGIFKSWFVDFDPVRAKAEARKPYGMDDAIAALFPDVFEDSPLGKIPRGWQIKALDQIADFLNGLALQNFPPQGDDSLPVIKIAQLRSGDTKGSDRASTDVPSDYVVSDGDVLFSWSGSLEVVIWTGGRGALNQHLFKVSSATYPKWFVFHWVGEHLPDFQAIAAGKATTMGHIQRHHLSEAILPVPPEPLLVIADRVMRPLFEAWVANALQNHTVAAIRDALLPKLISGEIRVKATENIAGRHL